MASYFPMVKNSAQRIVFPILDADGDPVTGAAADTPDSEYSLDGGSFTDITDEIHEIATNSGIYYLDLTTGETNGDVVTIQVKTATAGTKTTVLVFYTSAQSLNTVDTNMDTMLARWTAALATALASYTAVRAGYLDQLDFALQEAIAAIPTTAMRGTDNVVLAGPTKAQMDTAHGLLATPAQIATALANIHLDHLLAVAYDPASKPGVADALLNEIIENDAGVSRFTVNSLEQAPSGTGGDATAANQATLIKILTNKWEIVYNNPNWQFIIYDDDGTTPLYTFNLTRGGQASPFAPDVREPA